MSTAKEQATEAVRNRAEAIIEPFAGSASLAQLAVARLIAAGLIRETGHTNDALVHTGDSHCPVCFGGCAAWTGEVAGHKGDFEADETDIAQEVSDAFPQSNSMDEHYEAAIMDVVTYLRSRPDNSGSR